MDAPPLKKAAGFAAAERVNYLGFACVDIQLLAVQIETSMYTSE